jgi:hypothetical protein
MPSSIVIAAAYAIGFVTEMYASSVLFAMAANFAISYTVNRVFGAKPPRQQDNGVRQQIPPSADNSLPVVYGDAWLGGTFVDAVLTSDNQAMYYVLAISNISPNGQFTYDTTQFYYGDRLVTFAPGTNQVASLTDGAGNVDTKINGYLYINLYTSTAAGTITTVLGTAPNVAMGGVDIPASLRWPASGRQMNGLAFAIVYLKYSQDAGSTGLQPLTFKVKHALNGAGVAKPGSVLKDYLTNTVYGGAIPIANVNTTACDDLDTYSDQLITYTPSGGGSATQARYRINGVIDTGETALNNIENILLACDSWISYQAESGQWAPVINKAESTGFAFDDTNIIGDIRVSATDITSSINQVELSFPWKENKDKPGYVFLDLAVLNPSLLYPNEPVNKYTATLSMVNDSVQAQYLGNRMLEQAREDLIVSFNTAYPGIQVNAGDVVSVTNSAYGWTNKLFRVIKVNEASLPDGNLGARFELSEYNAAVYDDYSITAFTPAPNSDLQSGYFFPALSAPTFSDQAPSAQPPTFSVNCQLPSTVRVTQVVLYYTTVASPVASDWRLWGLETPSNAATFPAAATIKFANVNLSPATYYFAFAVANEISTSQLSATSAAFVWGPTATPGPTGPTGDTGNKTARAVVYRWDLSTPSISGTSTYTWATGVVSPAPSGWSTSITAAPSPGFSLYSATVNLIAPNADTTTTVNWTLASIVIVGYAGDTGPTGPQGDTGAQARVMFARIANNPVAVSATVTVSGDNRPTAGQSAPWGSAFQVTWYATDPNPSSNDSLYQSDGIYNGTSTTWTTPYISSLKVGTLSAITVNTGALTVQNTLTVSSTGNIQGGQTGYNTGTGFFLGYSGGAYKFSIGSSTSSLLWDGSQLQIAGTNVKFGIGTGSTPGGYSFEVTPIGLTYVWRNFTCYGGILIQNSGTLSPTYPQCIYAVSTQAAESIVGNVAGTNTRLLAHGVRGINNWTGSSGLVGPANFYDFYADGSGTNYGPFTGTHDALVPIGTTMIIGDIVVDVQVVERNGISSTICEVATATTAMQPGSVGIVCAPVRPLNTIQPAAFIESIGVDGPVMKPSYATAEQVYNFVAINGVGEGQLNVCGEGGNIQKGDLICSSNTTGKGMKQADDVVHSYTVARAREAVNFDDPAQVKTVACIYLCG